jgi:ribosomal protein L31E
MTTREKIILQELLDRILKRGFETIDRSLRVEVVPKHVIEAEFEKIGIKSSEDKNPF